MRPPPTTASFEKGGWWKQKEKFIGVLDLCMVFTPNYYIDNGGCNFSNLSLTFASIYMYPVLGKPPERMTVVNKVIFWINYFIQVTIKKSVALTLRHGFKSHHLLNLTSNLTIYRLTKKIYEYSKHCNFINLPLKIIPAQIRSMIS